MYPASSSQNASQDYTTPQASYYSPYAKMVFTNYETPSPNTYSPVPNSSPAALLATPNSAAYAAYMTPISSNSPASVANAEYVTPMQYSNFVTCSSPYPLIQVPAAQHSPMPTTTYLIDANTPLSMNNKSYDLNNNSQSSYNHNNNNNNNNNCNKENQRPNRGYKNNNKKYSKYNSNHKSTPKRVNYQYAQNENCDCIETQLQQPQQQQQPQAQQELQQVYFLNNNSQNYYYEATPIATSSQSSPPGSNDSYIPTGMPCNDITNYLAASQLPALNVSYGMAPPSQNDYYQHIDNTTDDSQDSITANDSTEDAKLACIICRGRKKCFCYFIKVGYHKFPSYVDYAEYHFKQWKTMQKPRRM